MPSESGGDRGSFDTPFDEFAHRPPARLIAAALSRTIMTPNQLTVLSLLPAFLATAFFSEGTPAGVLLGLLGFYGWAVLDHADGDLARLTGRTSDFGRQLDDACDLVASAAMLIGIFIGAVRLLPEGRRHLLSVLFAGGLVINAVSSAAVVGMKRRKSGGQRAAPESPAAAASRRVLNHFTGREPFYVLIFLTWLAFRSPAQGAPVLLICLVGGCYVLSVVSVAGGLGLVLGRNK